MPHRKAEIYLHFVWGTWKREAMLTPDCENRIYGCVRLEIEGLGCDVLAINGMPDHLHVVVRANPAVAVSNMVKQAKAVTTRMANDQRISGDAFKWQPGYGVFSLSRPHVERAVAYVKNQKRRHADNNIWPQWEDCGDDDE